MASWYMGKRIIPLIIVDDKTDFASLPKTTSSKLSVRLSRVLAEDQGIFLRPQDPAGSLPLTSTDSASRMLDRALRAAGALSGRGLDPEAFQVNRLKPPFPGLESFGDDDADAALYYGRSVLIANALEVIRRERAVPTTGVIALVGGSGSGKSSLMKAGLLPRLRREQGFVPLRSMRCGIDPLKSWISAIASSVTDVGGTFESSLLEKRLVSNQDDDSNLIEILIDLSDSLREAWNRPEGTIVLALDQAEDLCAPYNGDLRIRADLFSRCLSLFVNHVPRALFLTSLRSDRLQELQAHKRFTEITLSTVDVRPIETHRLSEVVEGPAQRAGLELGQGFVESLLVEARGDHALPLIAFGLERLWRHRVNGSLDVKQLEAAGGLNGIVRDAADRALSGQPAQSDAAPRLPSSRQIEQGRRTFVPKLVGLTDEGIPIRRVATAESFNAVEGELLDRFAEWRLVVFGGNGKQNEKVTIEIAHEALFREWQRLRDWLEPERAKLSTLRGVERSAKAWIYNGRDIQFLDHRGSRLSDARKLSSDESYRAVLSAGEREYLSACTRRKVASSIARIFAVIAVSTFILTGAISIYDQHLYDSSMAIAKQLELDAESPQPYLAARVAAAATIKRGLAWRRPSHHERTLASRAKATNPSLKLEPYGAVLSSRVNDLRWISSNMVAVQDETGASLLRADDNLGFSLVKRVSAPKEGTIRFVDYSSPTILTVYRSGIVQLESLKPRMTSRWDLGAIDVSGATISKDGSNLFWWTDTPGNSQVGLLDLKTSIAIAAYSIGSSIRSAELIDHGELLAITQDKRILLVSKNGLFEKENIVDADDIRSSGTSVQFLARNQPVGVFSKGLDLELDRVIALTELSDGTRLQAKIDEGSYLIQAGGDLEPLPAPDGQALVLTRWSNPDRYVSIIRREGMEYLCTTGKLISDRVSCSSFPADTYAINAETGAIAGWQYGMSNIALANSKNGVFPFDVTPRMASADTTQHGEIVAVDEFGTFWRYQEGELIGQKASESPLYYADVKIDDSLVLLSGKDIITIADLSNMKLLHPINTGGVNHNATWTNDGSCILTTNDSGTLARFEGDLKAKQFDYKVNGLAESPAVSSSCDSEIYVGTKHGVITRLSAIKSKLAPIEHVRVHEGEPIQTLLLSNDDSTLFVGSSNGIVVAFDTQKSKLTELWRIRTTGAVKSLDLQNKRLLIAADGGEITIVDSRTGHFIREFTTTSGTVASAAFGADDTIVIARGSGISVFDRQATGTHWCPLGSLSVAEKDLLAGLGLERKMIEECRDS